MCLVVSMVVCVSGWLHVSGGVYGYSDVGVFCGVMG